MFPHRYNGRWYIGYVMARIQSRDLYEAEELLAEVASWSENRIKRLPPFYQEKAREYRQFAGRGDE